MKFLKLLNKALVFFILSVLLSIICYAHGGKTDANGGHYNSSTGEYHYHHGYPAHQHPGGICPYSYDDKTDHLNGRSYSDDSNKSNNNYSDDFSYKTEEYNKYGNLNETEVIETILEQFRLDLSQKFLDRKILLYYYNWKDFSVEDCCLFLLSSFLEEHSCDHKFCDHKMLKYAETKDYEEGAHNTVYQLTEFANIYYKLYYRVGLLCENNEKIKELTVSANKIKETLDKQRIYKTV